MISGLMISYWCYLLYVVIPTFLFIILSSSHFSLTTTLQGRLGGETVTLHNSHTYKWPNICKSYLGFFAPGFHKGGKR